MAVDEAAPEAAKALMDTVMREDVVLGLNDLKVALRVFRPGEDDQIQQIDRIGLDTVRFDRATSRVHIVSHEFDKGAST
jgi:hypothetical protein